VREAAGLLAAHRDWLDEVEVELGAASADGPGGPT
jgi:hypothetical protein